MMPKTELDYESTILSSDQVCRRFLLADIQFATLNFDDRLVIGRGAFGRVYKCTINIRSVPTVVAVKRLNMFSSQGAPEFWAEVEMLGRLHHCNLVSLIGYCKEKQEMVLVYEYMKHGTLEDQLHSVDYSLSWLQRLRICIDAAHGLNYLHTGTGNQHGVIHRDVKTSNILLDENFAAKISDFGIAKRSPINQTHTYVSTQVKGTFGYLDPSYFYTGKLTRKSDVYAFGVVLLEVLCGRRAVDATLDEEQWALAAWAQECIKKGKLNQIIDSRIHGQMSSSCLKEFVRTTLSCLHDNPRLRPTMVEVVAKLGSVVAKQERMNGFDSNRTFIKKVKSLFLFKVHMKCNYWPVLEDARSDSEASEEDNEELLDKPLVGFPELENHDPDYSNIVVDVDSLKYQKEDFMQLIRFDTTSSFTMKDLLRAPAEKINRNRYSSIYRVLLDDGNHFVVKRLKKIFFKNQFDADISIVGKLSHTNIMALKACGNLYTETFLIYACSKNGTVESFLNGDSATQRPKTVNRWTIIKKIIVGITRGLVHLHTMENIIHGNLTSRNVLLDNDYNPFIVDIGLSRLRINSKPDYGYNHAPELVFFENATMETDVYGLGFIVFELLTRKPTTMDGSNLMKWVRSVASEKWTAEIFDAEIIADARNKEELLCMMHLAMNCTRKLPQNRLKADQVLLRLEEISATRKGMDKKIKQRNARKLRNMK